MYPSFALLGSDKDESIATFPINELIEKDDGFAGVFPGEQQLSFTSIFLGFLFKVFLPTLTFIHSILSFLCTTVYIITFFLQMGMFILNVSYFHFFK